MDSREAIIQAATSLIEENSAHPENITVREICKRADVGLGLVNYHFGNKDKLIEQCVERMINGIIENFQRIREETDGFSPFEKLEHLGNLTLDFLFAHEAICLASFMCVSISIWIRLNHRGFIWPHSVATHNAPKTKRKGYRQNKSPIVKTKAEQSFCYASTILPPGFRYKAGWYFFYPSGAENPFYFTCNLPANVV